MTYCFGRGWSNESGDYDWQPQPVSGSPRFTALTGGLRFTCGRAQAGPVYCWGWNQYGQRGDGTYDASPTLAGTTDAPTQPVTGNLTFKSIDAGYTWVCGTTVTDKVHCWGQNNWGAFGVDGPQINPDPVAMINASGLVFTASARGDMHSCAIASTTVVYCWGGGFNGQLADGLDGKLVELPARPTPEVARRR